MKQYSEHEIRMMKEELYSGLAMGNIDIRDATSRMRKIIGLTQADYAKKVAKISPRILSEFENGAGNPTIDTLEKIGKPFGLTVSFYLLNHGGLRRLNDKLQYGCKKISWVLIHYHCRDKACLVSTWFFYLYQIKIIHGLKEPAPCCLKFQHDLPEPLVITIFIQVNKLICKAVNPGMMGAQLFEQGYIL